MSTERTPGEAAPPSNLQSRAAPIIERAPLPTVEVHGSKHLVSHVNAAFCRLLGQSKEELVGRSFAEIVPGSDDCASLLDQVYQTGNAVTFAQGGSSGEEPITWLYAMWPALDPAERPAGVIIQLAKLPRFHQNVTDVNEALLLAVLRQEESAEAMAKLNAQLQSEITHRQSVVEQLALADRHKDEFMAMLAHELRNPLAPIKNAAQILRLAKSESFAVNKAQEIIERQVDHLAKLVDDLLDVSRIEKGKIRLRRRRVDLNLAVSLAVASCEPMATARGHTVTLDLQRTPAIHVDADPTRIDQILVNLIGNAVKYTPSAGAIHVQTTQEAGEAVIRVRDNGVGIEADMLHRIFDVFTQVSQTLDHSQGGLGLGLKLVKDLVELHGGRVEARSEGVGRGSELIVRLPALAEAAPAVAVELRPSTGRSGALRILVVDDSPDNRESMNLLLSMTGHQVELAEDGQEAVEKALQGRPDVAFIDIGLPRLNGYEVAREIRRAPGGTRIILIALSGYGLEDDRRKALDAGFDAYLTKPADAKAVTTMLDELVRGQQASG